MSVRGRRKIAIEAKELIYLRDGGLTNEETTRMSNGTDVVVLGAATSGRPHHRIGDRYQDLKDLGHDVDNPAAV